MHMLDRIKIKLLNGFAHLLGFNTEADESLVFEIDREAESDSAGAGPGVTAVPVTMTTLTPEQAQRQRFLMHARLVAAATAPTKTIRYIDRDGAVVWLSGQSPQDAHARVHTLTSLGFEILGVVDLTELPRKPTWEFEYEDPQCYMSGVVPRDDAANFNLGTAELRMDMIKSGMPAFAVVRATSSSFAAPAFYVH